MDKIFKGGQLFVFQKTILVKFSLLFGVTLYICFTLIYYISFQGFDHHVRHEHNMWSYIFFFIHLNGTKVNDYTALEMFVHKLVSLYSQNGQCHEISEYDQNM